MKRHLALLTTTIALVAAAGFWGLRQAPAPSHEEAAQAAGAIPQTAPIDSSLSFPVADMLANTSLAGTTVPADLTIDSDGRLIVNSGTRAILEYFLSLSGELSDTQIRHLIQQWAKNNAGPQVASDLLALLDRYNAYRHRFASGEYAASTETDIADKLRQRQRLRETIFGTDASALFADEDRYDQFSLKRHDILSSDMNEAEKERAMQALHASLPAHLAEQYRQQDALRQLQETEQSIRKTGGSSADRFAYHQQTFGDEAALRLQSLARERQQWQQRYQHYATQRDRILASGLVGNDKQQQLEQLRARLFAETEQQRVAALDRLAGPAGE